MSPLCQSIGMNLISIYGGWGIYGKANLKQFQLYKKAAPSLPGSTSSCHKIKEKKTAADLSDSAST